MLGDMHVRFGNRPLSARVGVEFHIHLRSISDSSKEFRGSKILTPSFICQFPINGPLDQKETPLIITTDPSHSGPNRGI